jgi:hypothetical protein
MRLTIIFLFENKAVSIFDDRYTLILMDGEKLPSIVIDDMSKSIRHYIDEAISRFIHLSPSFLIKMLSDVIIEDGEVEIVYRVATDYMHSINKIGNMKTFQEISTTDIWEKYGTAITGSAACFR